MKKLDVDDAVIYIFAHYNNKAVAVFPDVFTLLADMFCKYKTDNFLFERYNCRYTPNGDFYLRTKTNNPNDILTYSEKYINILKDIESIKDIDKKLGKIKRVLDYERPCNQEECFVLFIKQMIPILLFGFYTEQFSM